MVTSNMSADGATVPSTSAYWRIRYRAVGTETLGWRVEEWGTRDNADHRFDHLQGNGYDVELIEVMEVVRRKGKGTLRTNAE